MKIIYCGQFNKPGEAYNIATSIAADLVQSEIVEALKRYYEDVTVVRMIPCPSYPNGTFIKKSLRIDPVGKEGYILNLPILKQIEYSFYIIFAFIKGKHKIAYIYNPTLFSAIALLACKFFFKKRKVVSIIQDVDSHKFFKLTILPLVTRFYKYFDYSIAISKSIIADFSIDEKKSLVFQGGLTKQAYECFKMVCFLENIAVFAGALEPYNGVDKIVSYWLTNNPDCVLHVFGKGKLSKLVEEASYTSKKIKFHGFQPPEVINQYQSIAKFNFCLRYSVGLQSKYFFPSKFFEVLAAPGVPILTDNLLISDSLADHCIWVNDQLVSFDTIFKKEFHDSQIVIMNDFRRRFLSAYNWNVPIYKCVEALKYD